jgi:hypothetical protein
VLPLLCCVSLPPEVFEVGSGLTASARCEEHASPPGEAETARADPSPGKLLEALGQMPAIEPRLLALIANHDEAFGDADNLGLCPGDARGLDLDGPDFEGGSEIVEDNPPISLAFMPA